MWRPFVLSSHAPPTLPYLATSEGWTSDERMTAKKEVRAEGKESDSNRFPLVRRLFVTTRRSVYTWDANSVSECFRSGSAGILVARRVGQDGHLLAVADAEVVVLHDTTKEMDRSYKLKSTDVLCQKKLVRPPSIAANV